MSGVGDEMISKIKDLSGGAAASPRPAAAASTPTTDNDDDFIDDGISQDDGGTLTLAPIGVTTRPNGVDYTPRSIAGVEDLAFVRHCRDFKEHLLLYGPPGTGKTAISEAAFAQDAAAADDGTPLHSGVESIVCSADTTEADFVGTWVQDPISGTFTWAPGPLHRAVLHNIPLYVDEIFLADPRVLSSTLYPAMDGREVLRITANPHLAPLPIGNGFFVIGSGNPDVPGAVFSDALRDRFDHHIEVGTDWELARKLKVPGDIITVAKNLDKQRLEGTVSWSPQLRSLLSYRDAAARLGRTYALQNLVGKAPVEDRPVIVEAISDKFGKKAATPLSLGTRFKGGKQS